MKSAKTAGQEDVMTVVDEIERVLLEASSGDHESRLIRASNGQGIAIALGLLAVAKQLQRLADQTEQNQTEQKKQ